MTDAILPGSPPRGNIKGNANHFSPSSRFPTGQQQGKPTNMTDHILFSSPPSSSPEEPNKKEHILSLRFLVIGKTSQHEREHSLFFTDSLSYISSSLLSTMRRPHPIYGPLVTGKSFFHHSSFLLNQQILEETNGIFFNSCLNFSILIPVLTTASQLLL